MQAVVCRFFLVMLGMGLMYVALSVLRALGVSVSCVNASRGIWTEVKTMNSLRKRLMGVPITFHCFKCGARLISYRFCGRCFALLCGSCTCCVH
jgi:hypothetical protein